MGFPESLLNAGNVALFVVIIIGLMTLKRVVYIVPQSKNYVIERFGRFQQVLKPGLNVIVPFVDRVAYRISVLERQTDPSSVSVFSSDNVEVDIVTVVYWRVIDPELSVYRIEDINAAIMVATGSIVRNIGAGLELDNLQGSREEINSKILASLGETAEAWGISITRTEIVDIVLDEKTKQAQRQQVEAERARRAQVTGAEGSAAAVKLQADSVLYRSNQESEATVVAAQARAKEIGLVSEARAKEIEVVAAAQAKEFELVGSAIRNYGEVAALFELGKRQVSAMEQLAVSRGAKVLVLPTDVTKMLGSLAAVVEGLGFGAFVGAQGALIAEGDVAEVSETGGKEGGA
jgi:regulator of protease activity HflC (stomatin/prohibitin superfamily)